MKTQKRAKEGKFSGANIKVFSADCYTLTTNKTTNNGSGMTCMAIYHWSE